MIKNLRKFERFSCKESQLILAQTNLFYLRLKSELSDSVKSLFVLLLGAEERLLVFVESSSKSSGLLGSKVHWLVLLALNAK